MKLIKAGLHLHSKQSPGKLNYKSFIRQTSSVYLVSPFQCQTRIQSYDTPASEISWREGGSEAGYTETF